MSIISRISLAAALLALPSIVDAQVMRSQVYQYFMKAQTLQNRGQDSAAIAQLDEMANLVPGFPPTYLRMAEIYDGMYQRSGSSESLQAAAFMYRKYLTLEFNEEKIKEPSARLRELEDLLKIAHFEDEEMKDNKQDADDDIPVVVDMVAEEELAMEQPEAKPLELVSLFAAEESMADDAPAPVFESQLIPSLGNPKFSYFSFYNVNKPGGLHTTPVKAPVLRPENLEGHWVASLTRANGREMWIFDIDAENPTTCSVVISNESGIVRDDIDEENFFRRAFVVTKNYLEKTNILSNTKHEIVSERVVTRVDQETFRFSFEVEENYQSGTAIMKWSRNLVGNLQTVLPFGTSINNYLNNYLTQKEQTDKTRDRSIIYTFNCKLKAEDVIDCEITTVINSVTESGKNRSKNGATQVGYFYRTDKSYASGQIDKNYSSADYGDFGPLFEKVKADAAKDINYNYPLAILYYYGVGTKQSTGKAIELMNSLAAQKEDTRAKSWLSTYFYHKAYTDDSKNTIMRRRYLKSAQFWCKRMHENKQKEYYGVKGDMCYSDQEREAMFTTMRDSAMYYYAQGDKAGDAYSTYRLGSMYLQRETKNLEKAESLLLKAANAGQEDAIFALAHLALLKNDLQGYVHNLSLSADMGCPEAFTELYEAYTTGPSIGFPLDPKEGLKMKTLSLKAEKDDWIPVLLSYGYDIDSYRK